MGRIGLRDCVLGGPFRRGCHGAVRRFLTAFGKERSRYLKIFIRGDEKSPILMARHEDGIETG